MEAHVAQSHALMLPSENSGGIVATSDKSQFQVLFGLSHAQEVCAHMSESVCGGAQTCAHLFVWCLELQQEHLLDLGPSLLIYIQSLCKVLLDFSHTDTI